MMLPPARNDEKSHLAVSFQVAVAGSRAAGKSTLIRAALKDSADPTLMLQGDADGLQMQKVACSYSGLGVSVDFVELPAEARYMPLLFQFGATAACIAFVVNVQDPTGPADLAARLSAIGSPPPCGLLVVRGALNSGAGEERKRLEPLREIASRWGFRLLRFESLEQLERSALLQQVCSEVLHDLAEGADPIHLLGRRVAKGVGTGTFRGGDV
eukprot:TRINITY_DN16473_c0_g1_i1.p1 TRINITY_DN16473_c0_g1~~TRINITY_DN16473_c0_g1_i1.p1  ORF type:complete len:213 (+),score=47.73 TRINITY_DN16473_c0_g1_i1:78-716(+)